MRKTGIYRVILLAAAIIILCVSVSACKKRGGNILTNKQQTLLAAAAEAFYEYGGSYNSSNMLPMDKIEMFIYYYHNDKLEADESGYGLLSKEAAGEFLKTLFGINSKILPRSHSADGERLLYYADGNYHIKVSAAAAECVVKNVMRRDDGNYESRVACAGEGGAAADLMITFKFTDAGIRVFECERYDIA